MFVVLIIVFVALISFGLGRLSKIRENKMPITIENQSASVKLNITENKPTSHVGLEEGLLVGSKNGSKYHFPWCSGAQRIKEENKVWFSSKEEAESKGYTPAANCKGL